MKTQKKVKTECASIEIDDQGFLRIVFDDSVNDTIDLEEAKRIGSETKRLSNGARKLFLVDARDVLGNVTKEARDYFAKDPNLIAIREAEAFVINSLSNRILANFYINIHRPPCPVKIFTDEEKAINWLKSLRSN